MLLASTDGGAKWNAAGAGELERLVLAESHLSFVATTVNGRAREQVRRTPGLGSTSSNSRSLLCPAGTRSSNGCWGQGVPAQGWASPRRRRGWALASMGERAPELERPKLLPPSRAGPTPVYPLPPLEVEIAARRAPFPTPESASSALIGVGGARWRRLQGRSSSPAAAVLRALGGGGFRGARRHQQQGRPRCPATAASGALGGGASRRDEELRREGELEAEWV